MAKVDFLGKGWRFPVALDKTTNPHTVAYSEQEESIREAILIILNTAKGERVMRPDFGCGINEMVFGPNDLATAAVIAVEVEAALLKWEPRIDAEKVDVGPDPLEANRLNIAIEYRIKTNNATGNLVYPFYLQSK